MHELIFVIVFVPIFSKDLERCVQTVLYQTHYRLQVLLVFQDADEKNLKIGENLAQTDNRVKIATQKARNFADAANIGLRQAKGKYISFLSAVDFLEINAYEELVKAMRVSNAKISMSGYYLFDNESKDRQEKRKGKRIVHKDEIFDASKLMACFINNRGQKGKDVYYFWNKLFKRELFKNLFFSPTKNYDNLYLMSRLISKSFRVAYVGEALVHHAATEKKSALKKHEIKDLIEERERTAEYLKFKYPNLSKSTNRTILSLASKIVLANPADDKDKPELQIVIKDKRKETRPLPLSLEIMCMRALAK